MKKKLRIMLDSGAYSAWKKGEDLPVKEYIKYIKEHAELLHSYVSLDTIPGSPARMETSQAAVEKAAEASYRNHQVMRDAGLSPIPVFHQGERFDWLEKYLSDGEPYVGVSPYHRASSGVVRAWLDQCFTRLTDSRGRPIAKTHGFGVTWYAFLARYPWTTVDSVTWAIAPVYGRLTIPIYHHGEFDPLKPAAQFGVSGSGRLYLDARGSSKNRNRGKYTIDRLGDRQLEWIGKYAEMCGLTIADLRNDECSRVLAQVKYFKLIEERVKNVRFCGRRAGFAAQAPRQPISKNILRVVFSTSPGRSAGNWALDQCGVVDRLLSFYALRGAADGRLEAYIAGTDGSGERRRRPRTAWSSGSYRDFRAQRFLAREADPHVE